MAADADNGLRFFPHFSTRTCSSSSQFCAKKESPSVSTSCALQHMKGEHELKSHLSNQGTRLRHRETCHATPLQSNMAGRIRPWLRPWRAPAAPVPCAFWKSGVSRLRWHPTTLKAVSQVLDVDSTQRPLKDKRFVKKTKNQKTLFLIFSNVDSDVNHDEEAWKHAALESVRLSRLTNWRTLSSESGGLRRQPWSRRSHGRDWIPYL